MQSDASEILKALLLRRGMSEEEISLYLKPSIADLPLPESLPGIAEASKVLCDALESRSRIVVFGDYDCDGVCAAAILMSALQALGAIVSAFLPERLQEGYGMSDASVARMLKEYPDVKLVVTVDNGINSVRQIADLKSRGISVVVTDHHLPGDELPPADVLVNPKVSSPDALNGLCGAGVAFMLANKLVDDARKRQIYSGPAIGGPLLVLAGLATVTDIMPLVGPNRIFVAEALRRFSSWAPLGLKELYLRAARSGADKLTVRDFGYLLGPRINAAGRIASGMDALDLLLETNGERVREYARRIDLNNTARKSIEQRMTEEAMKKVVPGASAQVIDLPKGHPGVSGIVAARMLERLRAEVPVCVIAAGHGSARSPEWFNIRDAFVACSHLLATFGGHAAAGGFAVKEGKIDEFRAALCEYSSKFNTCEHIQARGEPEMVLSPEDLTLELAEALEVMEPFGEGNEEPVFGLKGVTLSDVRFLGTGRKHITLTVRPCGLRAVWWGHGDRFEDIRLAGSKPRDISFCLSVSNYGERHLELRLVSVD
ncbi:MAG: DHH family phosphoesterase [Kiritimatiellae bacterium]|nr:DHH family phosphoesterase [Kiritimatiellia bacterium]